MQDNDTQTESGPNALKERFFFMHIAKAAGSFVNSSLRKAYGDAFVEHCEVPSRVPKDLEAVADISIWSGHVFLQSWLGIENGLGVKCKRFTLVRDPLKQLASHIQWLDHYNLPEYQREFRALDPETQQVVMHIGATDIEDAADLDRYLTGIKGRAVQYFDNCQSRYFIAGTPGVERTSQLHLGHSHRVQGAMREFFAIGRDDNLPEFQQELSSKMGREIVFGSERVNSAKSTRRIPIDFPDVATVLEKRLTLDKWLYNSLKSVD